VCPPPPPRCRLLPTYTINRHFIRLPVALTANLTVLEHHGFVGFAMARMRRATIYPLTPTDMGRDSLPRIFAFCVVAWADTGSAHYQLCVWTVAYPQRACAAALLYRCLPCAPATYPYLL